MSYTSGYTPAKDRTILIDMRRMNHILEINEEDMYVTVEVRMHPGRSLRSPV